MLWINNNLAQTGYIYPPSNWQIGCSLWPGQEWWLNDDDPTDGNYRTLITMEGTVGTKIKLNNDDFYDDGDWNIWIIPSPGYEWAAINYWGEQNPRWGSIPPGWIEAEVSTEGEPLIEAHLPDAFPPGTPIQAHGWWVFDTGHDRRTELHPLVWMKSVNRNPFWIFVAQDITARFVVVLNPVHEGFGLDLPLSETIVHPGISTPSLTYILEEESYVSSGASVWGRAVVDKAQVSMKLEPTYFNNCEMEGRVIKARPAYLGKFTYSTSSLLNETVEYSVVKDVHTSQKTSFVKVTAELTSPPQGSLAYTKWRYESSTGTVIGEEDVEKTSPPHRIEFRNPYCPAEGYNQHTWTLKVAGCTRSTDYYAPDASGFSKRAFIGERRVYTVDPSTISIATIWKIGGPNQNCYETVSVSVDESGILHDIELSKLEWTVKKKRTADGAWIYNPQSVTLTGTTYDDPDYMIRIFQPSIPKNLEVVFKFKDKPDSKCEIELIALGRTELGEEVRASRALSTFCGVGKYNIVKTYEHIYRLFKQKGFEGELYKWFPEVPTSDRPWTEAFLKWHYGEPITDVQRQLILGKVIEGQRLPKLEPRDKLLKKRPTLHSSVGYIAPKSPILQTGQKTVLRGVSFPSGRLQWDPKSTLVLKRWAQILQSNPEVKIHIAAYTDNRGSRFLNLQLSKRRSQMVMSYFQDAGIDPLWMTAEGYGDANPIADNRTEAGRSANRRIEIHIQ